MVLHTLSRRRFVTGSAGAAVLAIAPPSLAPSSAGATASQFYATAKPGVRLRSGPGLGYRILATLSKGARLERLGSGGWADGYEWIKVRVVSSGKTGFVAFSLLATAPSDGLDIGQTVHVEAGGGRGNLRSGPGTGYRVIKTLPTGATGRIIDGPVEATGHVWHKAAFGNATGWIVTAVLYPGAGSS